MSDEFEFADAAGKAMAAIILANNVLGALILQGVVSHSQAMELVGLARKAAARLEPPNVATMAVAALSGLEKSWKKASN